jgi:autoinducer 2-binding protein LuxP
MRIFVVSLFFFVTAFASDYYSVDSYVKKYPEQKELMRQFNAIVQSDAVPINKAHQKVRIAVLYPGGQVSDYWRRSQKSFEARMDELKIDYELQAIFVDETDEMKLKRSLLQLLQNESDYLVFTLNISGHQKLISQLITNKKQKIILQNITTPLKRWEGAQPFLYVGFDHIEGTKLLANYLQKRQKSGAKYLMLYHTQGYVSQMRGDSFITMMQDSHVLQDAYYTQSNKASAYAIVKNYANIQSLDYIYACSTDVAVGASEALEELGVKKSVLINGWGGGSAELAMIEKGMLDVTVMRINDDNGVAMAEAIKLDILGQKTPLIYSGSFQIVDTQTPKELINRYKQRAFRYSK